MTSAGVLDALLTTARPLLAPAFTLWGAPVTWLEIVALLLAVAMVLANLRVHAVGWPLAIGSSLLYAVLFADSKLYGEASLQLVFVLLAGWGWWQWLRSSGGNRSDGSLHVHALPTHRRWQALAATLLAWPLLGLLLNKVTDSDVPFLDALPTVGSIAGQLLLGRKLVENWPVWVAVNIVSVGLFVYKALWLTALLYALFAVLALAGWRAWQARLKPSADPATATAG